MENRAPAFKSTGGARIGWISVSWPLAELSVTPRSLVIRAWLLGTYTFTPEQIVQIERYGLASLATERSPVCQRWVLKPGRSVGEIRPALRLIQLVSELALVIFAMVFTIA